MGGNRVGKLIRWLKKVIRPLLPRVVRSQWFDLKERLFLARTGDRTEIFARIHSTNTWGNSESVSGFGSTIESTLEARSGLTELIDRLSITSILDSPCGDYNWMSALPFEGVYTGVDIVGALVESNQQHFGDSKHRFLQADMVTSPLPLAELVVCRECLNHLPLIDGLKAIRNLSDAATCALVLTHYSDCGSNVEQRASFRYRPLNLTLAPFFLREPDEVIDESLSEPGKSLGIWLVRKGPVFLRTQ